MGRGRDNFGGVIGVMVYICGSKDVQTMYFFIVLMALWHLVYYMP